MNAWIYWIGWLVITTIYVIALIATRKIYTKRIKELISLLIAKDMQICVGQEIAKNYTKDTETLKKRIKELEGAKKND